MVTRSHLIAVFLIASLIGAPSLSFAKARGSGGGFSSGARGGQSSMGIGSRGSRTYQDNGTKPIEQSTTPKPSATPPPSAAGAPPMQPAPAAPSSWWQRNPLLAGIAGGLAGTWIGHMLFGATESSAKTTEAEPNAASNSASDSFGLILLLMLVGAGALYYFKKVRQNPAPVFTGLSRSTAATGSLLDISSTSPDRTTTDTAYTVTTEDKAVFQQLLTDIQSAWSAQDVAALRRFLTPEMLSYFSTALAEDNSRGVENHVEKVELLKGDVREAWSEGDTDYATVDLRWSACDYTVSTTIPRGEPGYLIEGSEETATESHEVWTFMRVRDGRWLLSAIQQ
ncbi:MAG: TIM44-like domain-containing protein [Nitrospira sp.]|nr:TIM44-like domain-containing protein [Nitrospira sp.]MDI3467340.1 Integral membrane protein [Nitrospira sp.]